MPAQAVQLFPIDNSDNAWRDEVFGFLNEKLDQIVEQNHMEKIDDITGVIFRNKSEILGRLVLGLIKKDYNDLLNQEYCDCPICGKSLKAWNKKVKRTIESLGGCLDLYRPYFYCKNCHRGFYPLDEALGLSSSPKQHDLQDLEAWLSSELPFKTAAEAFKRCTGDTLSADHMFETANHIANHFDIQDICPTKDEIDQKINELSKDKFRRPVMMMAIDGAHAPTRPEPSPWKGKRGKGEWKEAKGFRLYLIDTDRIIHLISWHQVQDDKQLAEALLTIRDAGLIPEDKVRLCVIGDGAPWIWNRVREIFPTIKEILDFYHCSEYIHDLANAQYCKGTRKAQEWVEATFARLFHNQVSDVIRGINRMEPTSPEAKEKIKDVVRYLSNHRGKVDYGAAKRGGYHIGSGAIESANKFIAHVRLKRSGAWWYITNANNILKLRCAKYNGTYDRIIQKYKELDRKKVYAKFHLANGF
ncbi:MAG: ISKra4 family transposase [Deltaproteobacteria bacterium]|nr:ISKra4 family transposase [Deltaproteobacteria bacterium]